MFGPNSTGTHKCCCAMMSLFQLSLDTAILSPRFLSLHLSESPPRRSARTTGPRAAGCSYGGPLPTPDARSSVSGHVAILDDYLYRLNAIREDVQLNTSLSWTIPSIQPLFFLLFFIAYPIFFWGIEDYFYGIFSDILYIMDIDR